MKSVKYLLCHELSGHGQFEILSCGPDREAIQQEADRRNQEQFDADVRRHLENPEWPRPSGVYHYFYVEEVSEFPLVKGSLE